MQGQPGDSLGTGPSRGLGKQAAANTRTVPPVKALCASGETEITTGGA